MDFTEYPALGERVFRQTLPNGLQVLVAPKPGFHSVYAAFAANYGGMHRRFRLGGELLDSPAGVAHYLEHKMFDLPGGDNALSLLTAQGADPNAFTSDEMTCYYFQCSREHEENLRLLLHFVSTPYFTQETVDKERGIIAQEIRMGLDSPGSANYYGLLRLLYRDHPIRDQVAGTEESIQAITPELLYACHKAFYAPGNMCLCVAGDVEPERVAAIAREVLGDEPGELPEALLPREEELRPAERYGAKPMAVSAPRFLLGAKLAPVSEPEALLRRKAVSSLALRLLLGRSSPFYTALYEKGLLNRDFGYDADLSTTAPHVLLGGESPEPRAVLEALTAQRERLLAEGLDAGRFRRAQRAGLGSLLRGYESFEELCLSLAEGVFTGLRPLELPQALAAVRPEDCLDFIREVFAPERLALHVLEVK